MAITEEEKEKLRHFALWYSSPVYREEYLEIVSRIDTVEEDGDTCTVRTDCRYIQVAEHSKDIQKEDAEDLKKLANREERLKKLNEPFTKADSISVNQFLSEALDPDNVYFNHWLNTMSEGTEAVEEEEQEGSLLLGPEGQEILKGYLDQLNRAGAGTEVQKEEERQATIEERLDALEENRQGFTLHKQELQRLDVSHRLLLKRVEEIEEAGLEFGDDITSLRDGQFSSNRRIDELLDRSVHDAELYGKCKERLNTHNALLDTLNAKIDAKIDSSNKASDEAIKELSDRIDELAQVEELAEKFEEDLQVFLEANHKICDRLNATEGAVAASNNAGDVAIGELRHRDALTNGRINSLIARLRNGGGSFGI